MTITGTDSYASLGARERYVPRGLANTHAIFVDRAEGTRVWDVDGKDYLDVASGIGVLNTGHRHPRVVHLLPPLTASTEEVAAGVERLDAAVVEARA